MKKSRRSFEHKVRCFLCNHEWIPVGNMRYITIHEYGIPVQRVCYDIECVKCGKHDVEIIQSPWCAA